MLRGNEAAPERRLGEIPSELVSLSERVRALPDRLRREIEPMLDDAMEQAVFRGRVLSLARDALARFRLDLEVIRFDLEQTRGEREELERRLSSRWEA
jgi:hypothetical protein